MNCHKVKALLIPFLEGELPGKSKEKIEEHLKVCASCQKEAEQLSKSWQMLDRYAAPKLKDDFTVNLMQKIRLERAKIIKDSYKSPRFSFWRLSPVLASLVIVVFIFSLIHKRRIRNEQPVEVVFNVPHNVVQDVPQETKAAVTDEDIVRNLDLYENIELLEDYKLMSELDVVESLDDKS